MNGIAFACMKRCKNAKNNAYTVIDVMGWSLSLVEEDDRKSMLDATKLAIALVSPTSEVVQRLTSQ
jgi:hypothetical protein